MLNMLNMIKFLFKFIFFFIGMLTLFLITGEAFKKKDKPIKYIKK
jgi:hypothetical protein